MWPPDVGITYETHILNWSMADRSFWKGFVPNSEVYWVTLGIAQTKIREAWYPNVRYLAAMTIGPKP